MIGVLTVKNFLDNILTVLINNFTGGYTENGKSKSSDQWFWAHRPR